MKKITPKVLMPVFAILFSVASAASIPALHVTVTNAAGKVAYKGTINSNGTFSTGTLAPGDYVVQFDSKSKVAKGNRFAISATAGKNPVGWNSVEGEKLVEPGIAVKIKVDKNSKITGQVAPAGTLSKQTAAANQGSTKSKYSGPVKIINGKRFIWVNPYTGSVEGGHWAEEGSDEANMAEGVNRVQGNQPAPRASSMSGGKY